MPRLSRVHVSTLAAFTLALTAGVAHADDAATFQSLMDKAVQAKDSGDLARAATLLGEAYRIRPAPELLNNMGKLYEGLGRYADAVEVYARVVASEDASAMLKTLDRTRIDLLSRKLGKAWIRTEGVPEGAVVFVDGAALVVDDEFDELGADPGPRVLEWSAVDGVTGAVHFLTLLAGKRTVLDLAPTPASSGVLRFGEQPLPLVGLVLNGYALQGSLAALTSLTLPPGRYAASVQQEGFHPITVSIAIEAGAEVDLGALMAAEPPPEALPVEGALNIPLGPAVTTGAGVVSLAAGVAVFMMGRADRKQVDDAITDAGTGPVTALSGVQLVSLDKSAQDKQLLGGVLMGFGAAAAGGGVYWWLFGGDDDEDTSESEPSTTFYVLPHPTGVQALVRF